MSRPPAWYELTAEDVFARLASGPTGLESAEATRRLAEHGPNELRAAGRVSAWSVLLSQFKNVLIVILLVATALSAVLGHGVEAVAITAIVLFAVLLGFVQEFRAERAIEALQQIAAPTATVLRDGTEREIPARDLVPGDLILLRAGNVVPADARVTEAVNLRVEEAVLTGESVPVDKLAAQLADRDPAGNPRPLPIGDRRNMVYSGTVVTYGRGAAVVVATGMHTEFGQITSLLQSVETGRTPLQENLDRMGKTLAKSALVVVALIVIMGLLRGRPFIEMFIFGIALAVAVVPEALPAVVTISLALGVQRMLRRNALVRRLPVVETLGSTTVICSDKTGTLTRDEMTVRQIFTAGQLIDVSGTGYERHGSFSLEGTPVPPSAPLLELLRGAALASDARLVEQDGHWSIKGDPTEGALIVAAAKAGLDKAVLDTELPRVHEIPFTSESKRMTTLHAGPEGLVAYSKGAAEIVLDGCSRWLAADGIHPLDAAGRTAVLEQARQMANQALRVLGVATRRGASMIDAERDMTFLGLVGMIDPPRPEARTAIQACEQAGIKVAMITGDHPLTAQAVARDLGVLKTGRLVTGADLDTMSDDEFERDVERIEVYARVSPAHKLRVVTALQQHGHTVAMTGDGVNDAPALKKADIGIAMGITGTDVTKEAASMTLTDDNFASIVAAVEEGRAIFENIKKYLMYLLSSNLGEIGLMAGATLLGLPLPLTAVQLLYVNLATDGLPALALAVDPPDKNLMQRKPRDRRSGVFTRPVVTLMAAGGLWSALVNLSLFAAALRAGRSTADAMTLTFVSLVIIQFFKAYNFRSDRESVLKQPFANRWLNLAILWELILLSAIVYVPWLHDAFGTTHLSLNDWVLVAVVALTVSPVLELAKWWQRRGQPEAAR